MSDELSEFVEYLRSPEAKHEALGNVSDYPERGRVEYVYATLDHVANELEQFNESDD